MRIGTRSSFLLLLTTLFGIAAFAWPLMIHQSSGPNSAHNGDAPWIFVGLVPLLLAIVMAELSEGAIDAKAVALLGILAACFAALRVPSPGINGFEPEWFLLILSARVFGRGFGFVLGAVAFFASALITGGVGPWLPFQMLAAAWVGFGAGCLPPMRGFPERLMLAGYGVVSALVYGLLTNFWFWPFVGGSTTYSFVPGLGTIENLHRFILFDLTTSMGFDLTQGGDLRGHGPGVGPAGPRCTAPRLTPGGLRAADPIHRQGGRRISSQSGRAEGVQDDQAVKIVSLLPSATEIVYALGLGEHLRGVSFECDYPEDARSVPVVSGTALPTDGSLGLSFGHLWQIPVLAGALVWLFVARRSVVSALLIAGGIGVVVTLAGVRV